METRKLKVTVLGDICPAWGFPEQFLTGQAANVFGDLLSVLSDSDLVIANLEAPATELAQKLAKNSVCLKARPGDLAVLKQAGIDGVALANNHILDYTEKGFFDTRRALEANGLFYYGAGTPEDAAKPYFVEKNGVKVGLLAFAEREFNCAADYGVGANLWEDLTGPESIRKAKAQCDYLIVQYHGGIEHYIYPSPLLQKKCRAMAAAGADLVTCQHSHCIGTRERWENCEILYGQGNAIFGYKEGRAAWNRGLLLQVTMDQASSVRCIPITATPNGERLAEPEVSAQILREMKEASEKLEDCRFIAAQWDAFCARQKNEYLPMAYAWGRVMNKLNRMSGGKLIQLLTHRKHRRDAMNLLRCDAHREVLQTIMEKDYYKND